MRPLVLIPQETNYDCGAACLGTVLGLSLALTNQLIGRDLSEPMDGMRLYDGEGATGEPDQIGLLGDEIVTILFNLGIPALHMFSPLMYAAWKRASFHTLQLKGIPQVQEHIENGGVAILAVPSHTCAGQTHWIVSDGGRILDPGMGKLYKRGDLLHISQFVLVRGTT